MHRPITSGSLLDIPAKSAAVQAALKPFVVQMPAQPPHFVIFMGTSKNFSFERFSLDLICDVLI